jgi:alginate O-acetyltransferase complex protein AlgI
MLFNSFEFLLGFFPAVFILFYGAKALGQHRITLVLLTGASLFFYGWWNPWYLWLIIGSILFNYTIGKYIRAVIGQNKPTPLGNVALVFGITCNLALLGYFKYANFFIYNFSVIYGESYALSHIALPLAISFFTFQQVTYLVDSHKGDVDEHNFLQYALFVTFFPQLIAGPIVHHKEMMPQFESFSRSDLRMDNLIIGLSIFSMGLFKKVILADGIAVYANLVFDKAIFEGSLVPYEAWFGALAYTFQIYFDFSGYSDMAIGLARVFGILLPLNFNSPYKATNIIDFWRRWHITLSRFLKDYLYIPLGGNRKGDTRRYTNLMVTMLLGGLWHGAGWTFIIWGGLHGFYLIVNHLHLHLRARFWSNALRPNCVSRCASRALTFVAVVVGWVFFRAETLEQAWVILCAMTRLTDLHMADFVVGWPLLFMVSLFVIAWGFPNTQEVFYRYDPAHHIERHDLTPLSYKFLQFRFRFIDILFIVSIALISILAIKTNIASEFLYYDF